MNNIFKKTIITIIAIALFAVSYDIFLSKNPLCEKGEKLKKTSGAMESLQFMSEIRAFPDTDIPADKFYKAYEYTTTSMQELNMGDSPTEWTSIGPNNIGGRSLSLAFSPTDTGTIYMGSAS